MPTLQGISATWPTLRRRRRLIRFLLKASLRPDALAAIFSVGTHFRCFPKRCSLFALIAPTLLPKKGKSYEPNQ